MNRPGSRNIAPVLRAILSVGNGQRISYVRLVEITELGITNTVAKAVYEAEQQGFLIVERGHGRVANHYQIPESVRAIL